MNRAWSTLVPITLLPLFFHWMPLWRRHGIWFGVTVAPGFTEGPEAREVLHRFRVAVWLLAFAAALAAALAAVTGADWPLPVAFALELGGALAAFVAARHQTLPHAARPDPVRAASLALAPEDLPGGIAAALIPFVVGAAALCLYLYWDSIPERFAVHWTIDGTPDRWSGRTWQGVYMPLIAGAVQTCLMLLVALGILRASPRGRVAANAAATAQFRRVMLQFMIAAVWGMSFLLAAVSLVRVFTNGPFGDMLPVLIAIGLVCLTVPFVFRLIRINRGAPGGGDGTPDACWKLGLLYFNPDDPAIFIPKRFGIGYTCNFGNRITWLSLGVLLLLAMVPVLLTRL